MGERRTGHCLTGLHTQLQKGGGGSNSAGESPFMDASYVDGDGKA